MVTEEEKMKLSCQENLAPGKTLKEKLDNLAKYGFEGVEFWGMDLRERLDEVKSEMGRSPLKVSTICAGYRGSPLSPDPEERRTALEDAKALLEAAAELGAVGLIFVPVFGPPKLPDLSPYKKPEELERELLLTLLYDLAKHAEKVGSVLLLEPLNRYETHFIRTLDQAVEYVEEVGSPGVRIMADFFHMNIEEADIAESIRRAGKYIYHVHLADSNRVLPGWGHTDFESGFRALKDIGYDKFMAMECRVPGDPEEDLPRSVAYLREFM